MAISKPHWLISGPRLAVSVRFLSVRFGSVPVRFRFISYFFNGRFSSVRFLGLPFRVGAYILEIDSRSIRKLA